MILFLSSPSPSLTPPFPLLSKTGPHKTARLAWCSLCGLDLSQNQDPQPSETKITGPELFHWQDCEFGGSV